MTRDREDTLHAVDGFAKDEDFERLFFRYYGPIRIFFINRGLSSDESDDLTQDTFVRAYRSMGQFRNEASIRTWLLTIATNVWRNTVRSRRAAKRQATALPLEDNPSSEDDAVEDAVEEEMDLAAAYQTPLWVAVEPLEEALSDERASLLREALAELPPQMRRCMVLRVQHDLKYREIAALMAISIDTVKSQLSQARDRLRARLADQFADIEL